MSRMAHEKGACARFEAAMDVLGKPWTGLVFDALDAGPRRFSEIRESIGDIGDRMLALRLRDLEERGLLTRHVIAGPPVRVEYALTRAGRGFREVADAARRWGATILEARDAAEKRAVAEQGEPKALARRRA
jgi:DNA-binding HxlR family transcriptional regulator